MRFSFGAAIFLLLVVDEGEGSPEQFPNTFLSYGAFGD
jgi:hypothetical protein